MNHRSGRRRVSILLLSLGVSLAAAAGCGGDDTVRGAGSIDVPRPGKTALPEKSTAGRGKTIGLPVRAR